MADINLLQKLVDDDSNKDELAFKVNKDNYVSIQTCSDGYDYSIYGSDYRVLDGGIYDDPDVSIFEALNNVCEDYFKKDSIYEVTDYDELVAKSNDAEIEYVNKHRMTR